MINLLNALTDMDWGWWPFLSLRPKQHELMTTKRVALMSVAFSGVYGTLLVVLLALASREVSLGGFLKMLLWFNVTMAALFFVMYRLIFAVAWNVRAKRLASEKS